MFELRAGRFVGVGEICDAMIDRADLAADLACLFSSDQLAEQEHQRVRGCDCGLRSRRDVREIFNKALES